MPWKMISEALGIAGAGTVKSALDGLWGSLASLAGGREGRNRAAFTIAVIALSAKMAKADGVALRVEAEAFERNFHVPHDEIGNVKRVFDLAKQDTAGFEAYAAQIARILKDEPELLHDVFEGLFHIASADGVFHGDEEVYLKAVATRFGLSAAQYVAIRRLFVRDRSDPYEVLGLPAGAGEAEVKARHRQLVLENHPDRLIAHGVPQDFIDLATRKLAAINAAYDAIRKERTP